MYVALIELGKVLVRFFGVAGGVGFGGKGDLRERWDVAY